LRKLKFRAEQDLRELNLKFKRERRQRLNLSLASAQIEILNLDADFSGSKIYRLLRRELEF